MKVLKVSFLVLTMIVGLSANLFAQRAGRELVPVRPPAKPMPSVNSAATILESIKVPNVNTPRAIPAPNVQSIPAPKIPVNETSALSSISSSHIPAPIDVASKLSNNLLIANTVKLYQLTPKTSAEEKAWMANFVREAIEWEATCAECTAGFKTIQERAIQLATESKGALTVRESFELALKERGLLERYKQSCL